MPKSTSATRPSKPAKPHKDFPLHAHATGRWAKKVRGKRHYFGSTAKDPEGEAALLLWLEQKDDLLAGRTWRPKTDGLTVRDLVNRFLTAKQHLVDTREISPRTFADYHATCGAIVDAFGTSRHVLDLRPDDFTALRITLAKRLAAVALGNTIQRVRSVFKFAYDSDLIEKPLKFGQVFRRPTKKALRKLKGGRAPRMFEAAELRGIIEAAGVPLKAMILLGINAGFGNSDCGNLPMRAVDLGEKWIRFPRPKTGVERRCPLWPETVEALKAAIDGRPKAKDEANGGLMFIAERGLSWHKDTSDSPVAKEFRKLVDSLGVHRERVGFYSLRHTFQTIADEARDPVAAALIMGHVDESMSDHYRERIGDDRLMAVVNHVRGWLFPPKSRCRAK